MVFYHWWRANHLSREVRLLERVAILHREEVVRRTALQVWQTRTRDRIRQLQLEVGAVMHQQLAV